MGAHVLLFFVFVVAAASPLFIYLTAASVLDSVVCPIFIGATITVLAAGGGVWIVMRGLVRPISGMRTALKEFISGGYRLETVIPKDGWAEPRELIPVLNRLMLELGAYRAFHLNQLVEERAKAQALMETITDGVLLLDDHFRLICSNKKGLEMLGLSGKGTDLKFPDDVTREPFSSVLPGLLASREKHVKAEVSVPWGGDAHHTSKSYRISSRLFPMATLKQPGRVVIIRDVTLEKEIENARETFFHMITHDMRAPLSSILGYAELIRKQLVNSPDSEKWLQAILRSSVRLNGMIEDILNTIKLERGEMKLNPVRVNAKELCQRVLEVHAPLAARRDIVLTSPQAGGDIVLCADAILLERIITNLVGNSLKFTPAGGRVTLSFYSSSGSAVFMVEDNGPGIPKENQSEIFEKYSQLEEHKYMGFGLGLAMCKLAVELHGGRIWVDSEPGHGSRFLFSIPYEAKDGKNTHN